MTNANKRSLYGGIVVGSFVSGLLGQDIKVSMFVFLIVALGMIYWELTK